MASVVLVTGCSAGGIGAALCEEFAAQGCQVYATARNPAKMAGFSHSRIEKLPLDVTSDEDVKRVVEHIVGKEGKIDIVVNNAGTGAAGALLDQDMDTVRQAFDINTFAILRVCRSVLPIMAGRKQGLFVNVGSVVGDTPVPWNGLYSATKAATHMISEVLSMECRPFNISVMNVVPGSVRSNIANNMTQKFVLPENSLYSAFIPNIMKRINASQTEHSMPAAKFAKAVVSKALSRKPPLRFTAGGNSTIFAIFRWLPRVFVFRYLWRIYSKKM
ncbi:oxidoreductase [Lentinula edodes]|uniref:oxidoreductase n=1 Tax=Lentinula edodes TaxID=5353 RepID=UPI001E8DE169|nr:oxidoreductase [Lentinula edodes]KAH7870829.1 oxidoreductase [Lentinula edodes]